MGMLLDPARPQPVPIGSLVRSAGPAPARHWLVWPDARLRPAQPARWDGSAGPWPPTSTSPRWPTSPASSTRRPCSGRHRRPGRRPPRRPRHRMRRRGRLRRRRRGGRRRDGVDRRDAPPGDPEGQPPRRHPARARPRRPEPPRPAPAGVPMALTAATRVAVITRRGHSRIGLAQSRDEAGRWMEDAIRYCAASSGPRPTWPTGRRPSRRPWPRPSERTRRRRRSSSPTPPASGRSAGRRPASSPPAAPPPSPATPTSPPPPSSPPG